MTLSLAIDASRNRSGGSIAHMIGIIRAAEPEKFGISKIHVWSYRELLNELPERAWLVKHNPPNLERGILAQLYWQRYKFSQEIKKSGCQILLNTDAGTVGRFKPAVTMSRDMLSYEPGEINRYGFSRARLRLFLLRYMQNQSMRMSDGVIFLTNYASSVIQKSCGNLHKVAIIPHGVSDGFRNIHNVADWPDNRDRPISCIYVSNIAPYKHQCVVVRAVERLVKEGFNLTLALVGGGDGQLLAILEKQINSSDPEHRFVKHVGFVPHENLPDFLSSTNLFIFASSCENMPNTLVEGMAAGFPIACSRRGPMPELLHDGGVYFDPEDDESIADAVRQIITDAKTRQMISARARELALKYSWERTADETLTFITDTYNKHIT